MPLVLGGSAAVTAAYSIDNSCRFNSGTPAYLVRTPGSAGSRTTMTFSWWFKRAMTDPLAGFDARGIMFSAKSAATHDFQLTCFDAANGFDFSFYDAGTYPGKLHTNATYRDTSAWMHCVAVWDTTNVTAGDRMRLYFNGVEATSFSTDTQPSLDEAGIDWNNTEDQYIGVYANATYGPWEGYMSEVVFIDGTVYGPTDFGEFNEDSPTIWQPKDPTDLTFGTQGFWLDFKDSSNLGNDVSGNGNDYTSSGLAAIDQATDSPTNNFATFNPLGSNADNFAEGNLYAVGHGSTSYAGGSVSTIGVKKGKWYIEWNVVNVGADSYFGIMKDGNFLSAASSFLSGAGNLYMNSAGEKFIADGSGVSYGTSFTSGDIISVALDMDNRDIYFYKNGVIQDSGTAAFTSSDITDDVYWFPFAAGKNTGLCDVNFGGCNVSAITSGNADANGYGNFEYAVPSGYYAICTKNLAEFGG